MQERANPAARPKTMPLLSYRVVSLFLWNIWEWILVTGLCFRERGCATSLESLRCRYEAAAYSRQDIITTSAQVLLANASLLLLFLFSNLKLFWNLGCTFFFYDCKLLLQVECLECFSSHFIVHLMTVCSSNVMFSRFFCAVMLTFSVTRASHVWTQWIVVCLNYCILQRWGVSED